MTPNDRLAARRRAIGVWVLALCAMVVVMVSLGGVTRLTHSGLSMVDWRPVTGWLPPLGETEWRSTFEGYRQSPEFRHVNFDMDLDGFKSIFWLEYLHRLWGRLMGVAFLVPFVLFAARGWVDRRLAWRLGAMFVLGGLQGAIGWYMVKSGLVDRPDVSQYRLTAHLGAAMVILAYMLWTALDLLVGAGRGGPGGPVWLRRAAAALPFLVLLVLLSGGFVAGLDAGLTYNTFPLMDGELVPHGMYALDPWWLNWFENVTTVQFDHRLLAVATVAAVLALWAAGRDALAGTRARAVLDGLALVAAIQATLGVSTLLLVVPLPLAALHQLGAVCLFGLAVWLAWELKPGK